MFIFSMFIMFNDDLSTGLKECRVV